MTKTLVRDTTKGTPAGYRDPNRGISAYRVPSVVAMMGDVQLWLGNKMSGNVYLHDRGHRYRIGNRSAAWSLGSTNSALLKQFTTPHTPGLATSKSTRQALNA